jgi:hypothetical protein
MPAITWNVRRPRDDRGMPTLIARAVQGFAAGCVGLVALEITSYVDQYVRGRPASDSPTKLGAALGEKLGLDLGVGETRMNRASSLGPLAGYWDGLLLGAAWSVLAADDASLVNGTALLAAAATAGSNGPLIALGVTDPRDWSRDDWLSDLVPHLAYGLATAATIAALRAASRQR